MTPTQTHIDTVRKVAARENNTAAEVLAELAAEALAAGDNKTASERHAAALGRLGI